MNAPCVQALKRAGAARQELASKTRELGFLGVIRHVTRKIVRGLRSRFAGTGSADVFDAKYGTDTAKTVGVWALDIPRNKLEHAHRYETIDPERLVDNFRAIEISHQDFVFIDFGSGKGRTLLLASLFPFKEIIGVELSAVLCNVANRNIAIYKEASQKCHKVRSLCMDVTDFQLPTANILLYLFNPFDEHVMAKVVAMMEQFVRHSSNQVYVLYHHPAHKSVWDKSDIFEEITAKNWFAVYKSRNTS